MQTKTLQQTVTFKASPQALKFTQIGIPPHRYSGHYRGWIETYWTPMKEIFATGKISDRTRTRVHINRTERINRKRFRRKVSKEA